MVHAAFLALIVYALQGVGVCCDDFPQIAYRTAARPVEEWQATPVLILTHGLGYGWIGYQSFWLYDVLKTFWVALAYGMVYRFGTLWFTPGRAAVFAALFLLYPSHDSTVFWYSNQYLTLVSAFYLYAYYLADRGRALPAIAMSLLAAFVSYGSPPWALGLGLVFVLRRRFVQAAQLLVPQVMYIAYYLALTEVMGVGSKRLPSAWDPLALARQMLLQVFGGLDAVAGPSIVLKTWGSIGSLSLFSTLVGIVLVAILARNAPRAERPRLPATLWWGVAAVVFAGFGIFAVTGGYPQGAFGMGNRVTIYASFGMSFALCALPWPRSAHMVLCALLVFSTLGASDHWRAWRAVQDRTIETMRARPELRTAVAKDETLFVVGPDYSRLAGIGHIAFLTEPWMTEGVIAVAIGERPAYQSVPLSHRFRRDPGGLLDTRHGRVYPLQPSNPVYFAETGVLKRVAPSELEALIETLKPPPRHWLQRIDVPWLRRLVVRWMPQLGHLFHDEGRISR